MNSKPELSTSEVAREVGVPADLIRKWKNRGFLKLAPQGVPGQGRGVECLWSPEAVVEVIECARTRQRTKPRTRGAND